MFSLVLVGVSPCDVVFHKLASDDFALAEANLGNHGEISNIVLNKTDAVILPIEPFLVDLLNVAGNDGLDIGAEPL